MERDSQIIFGSTGLGPDQTGIESGWGNNKRPKNVPRES